MFNHHAVLADILDPFTQTTDIQVIIKGGKKVVNGSTLKPSQVSSRPTVNIGGGDFRNFYTLVMIDPDAPSPSNPIHKEYLHWIVTDIPGSTNASFGNEIMTYEDPQPTLGIHRLVFVLFKQKSRQIVVAPEQRQNFNIREFSQQYNLDSPVAATHYNCHRENGTGARRLPSN
ncbi:hypothetical protein ACP275_13G183500 [Erythranthe tilingii]